jgi:predicted flavoprotein YhiN
LQRIKAVRLTVHGSAGMERAISTAGGVRFDGLTPGLMIARKPGVFVAGEMLDWEAPTGGYLLQARLQGVAAANGVRRRNRPSAGAPGRATVHTL